MRDVLSVIFLLMLFRLFSLVLLNKSFFRNARLIEKAIQSSNLITTLAYDTSVTVCMLMCNV